MKNTEKYTKSAISGVTLVEMSVVLVIIAFVLLAVMKGQELVHKSRMDSAVADLQKYKIAAQQFREKYYYLPGDISNPTQYISSTACANVAAANSCAGNGDGQILRAAGSREESLRAWQHLALTEMITGSYSGRRCNNYGTAPVLTTPSSCAASTSKVIQNLGDGTDNIPPSKLEYETGGKGGYWMAYGSPLGSTSFVGNYVLLGRDPVSVLTDTALNGIISPKNAAAIDRKIDDSNSQTGVLFGVNSAAAPTACNTGGNYDFDDDTQSCVVWLSID